MKVLLLAAVACATPLFAADAAATGPLVTYDWVTTSKGYGTHVDQPTMASFDVPLADVLAGKIMQSDVTNIRLAYPDLKFDSTIVSGLGSDFGSYVDPKTGDFIFKDVGQGFGVIAFGGTDINLADTYLSITVGYTAYTPAGQPLNKVGDQFNALKAGLSYAGYPTAGYWHTDLVPVSQPGGTVPEPASWAMFIAGFGLVGWAMRQRQRPLRLA